jgi:hypothetical protein
MGRPWKRSTVPWLFIILQSHGVASRKRGVRKPRMSRSRFLEEEPTNIFLGLGKGGKGLKTKIGKGSSTRSIEGKGKGKGQPKRIDRTQASGKGKGAKRSWDYSDVETLAATTTAPTGVPTLMPTIHDFLDIPSRNSKLCRSKQGMFGSERGESHLVVFVYQVELDPGTTKSEFETTVLPQLEVTVIDMLVPYAFDNICGLFRSLNKVTDNYAGISALPSDHILTDGELCVQCVYTSLFKLSI